jgi:hypothetical protein
MNVKCKTEFEISDLIFQRERLLKAAIMAFLVSGSDTNVVEDGGQGDSI